MSLLIASFPQTKDIGRKVAKELKAEYTEIFVEDFPDSEFHLSLKKNPRNKTVVILNSITKDPDEKLIETILAGGIARDYKAKKVILMATYFPYLRQDKHFFKYDSFSSKHIIKLLSNFDKIITIDPHLHRIKSMRELSAKAESISAKPLIIDYLSKNIKGDFQIIGPDEESVQWSKPIAEALGKKVTVLKKTRFSSTNVKIKKTEKGVFSGKAIIVDDIISTGRTIIETLKLAKQNKVGKLICVGIHGLLLNNADKEIKKYADLITTNTIPNNYSKIDVSPIIVEALKKYK